MKEWTRGYRKGKFHPVTSADQNINKYSQSQMSHDAGNAGKGKGGSQLKAFPGCLFGRSVMTDQNELWWGYVWRGTQVAISIWSRRCLTRLSPARSDGDGWCALWPWSVLLPALTEGLPADKGHTLTARQTKCCNRRCKHTTRTRLSVVE